jgi:tRNA-modifying protein YgfZ
MPATDLVVERARLDRVRNGALVVTTAPAVFRVAGSGALQCLQGLLTNDLAKPGEHSLVYGALLTPKGMIVADYWVLREPEAFTLLAAPMAREATLEIFRRQLPPRLARVTDLTGEVHASWTIGAHAFQTLVKSGIGPMPESCGRVATTHTGVGPLALALAHESAYFSSVAVGSPAAAEAMTEAVAAAGGTVGDEADLEAARILCGWPALGAEIDERTLPQEVRYDEIGGVSYTKGCYTGQETVARLHFRGHTNRELRGLLWRGTGGMDGRTILHGSREVGTVRSTLELDDRIVGLAPIRREVADGDEVTAGGRPATVTALPFSATDLDA